MLAKPQPKTTAKPILEAKPAPMSKDEQRETVRKLMVRYKKTIAYLGR
jgi:hypothetical protein